MADKENIDRPYINTPYAYTKLSKNLSLFQQSVLIKVSEHLQYHIQKYFGSDLCRSHSVPRPLFSDADKNNGMPDFFVPYAELGVSINNYQMARAAVREVMALTIDAPGTDNQGNPSVVSYSVFSKVNASTEGGNGIAFGLNPIVVDYVFDMSQGYVRHPVDIARIAQVERMPMMYYFLFKKSERWKKREVQVTVAELKVYLGMRKNVSEGKDLQRGRPTGGEEPKEAYPKFSQFNKAVLSRSTDDMNRLCRSGLLDVCVSYELVYSGKRKVGNPTYIRFFIHNSFEEMKRAAMGVQDGLFATPTPPEPTIEDYPGRYAEEWQELLRRYTGALRPWLVRARHYGASQAGFMSIRFADKRTLDEFNAECQKPQNKETYCEMMRILAELIGKPAARVLVRGVDER